MQGPTTLGTAFNPAKLPADVVINPAVAGTGPKIKNVEALGSGKILITTSHGAEGFGSGNPTFLIADSAAEFAARIVDILSDLDRYNDLAEEAYQYARGYNKRQLDAIGSLLRTETNSHRAP
ncbi:glycosyltransferase [Pseudomonadota bacterium]